MVNLFMLAFVLSSLFGTGLSLTLGEIIAPFKKTKLVFLALLGNFLLIPLLTYALAIFFKLDESLFNGLMLLACCAGAPFLPALANIAGGSIAFSVGLMVLLMLTTVFYAPIVLPLIIPNVAINPLSIASPLIFYMLLPLIVGLIIKAIKPDLAGLIRPFAKKISLLSIIIMAVLFLFAATPVFIEAYGTGVYNAMLIFVAGSLLIGYLFSGLKTADKSVMALGAGQRNIMAALLIAVTNFSDHKILVVILIGSLVGFVVLFPAAAIFKKLQQHV